MLLQQADSIYCYACSNIWNVYHFMFNTKLPYINLAQNYVAYRIMFEISNQSMKTQYA